MQPDDAQTLRRDLNRTRQTALRALTAVAAVNAKTQRQGVTITGPFAVGNTDVTITWPNPWPDAGYGVYVSITSGTAALGSLSATLKAGTKTANDCVITVANTGASAVGTFGLDVLGVRA